MQLSRRSLLLGSGAAIVLAACGGDDDDASTATTGDGSATTTTAAREGLVLGEVFDRNNMLVAGLPQRTPFALYASDGGLAPDPPDEIAFLLLDAESQSVGEPVTADRHGDDVERPYYAPLLTFPEPGLYTIAASVPGLTSALTREVNVNERGAVPQVGDLIRPFTTPTVAAPGDVQTICTDDPQCPLHEISFDTALAEGRPVALLMSTPAFCQVAICGPVLDLLVAAAPAHANAACVHLEVYPNGSPPDGLSPLVASAGIQWEPVLFVTDGTGRITTRLDNIYDGAELEAALATVA